MRVDKAVNYEELGEMTDDFNAAQLKVSSHARNKDGLVAYSLRQAVAVEAGMVALREGATILNHEHFITGINEVAAKKKSEFLGVFLAEKVTLTFGVADEQFYVRSPHKYQLSRLIFFTVRLILHCWNKTPTKGQIKATPSIHLWSVVRSGKFCYSKAVKPGQPPQHYTYCVHAIILPISSHHLWSKQ